MDRTSTISTSSGHTWTTEDSNLTTGTELTSLSQDSLLEHFRDPIFTQPISEETRRLLVQAILDRHPSICQNNPSPSQDNTANNTPSSLLNEEPLNNPPSHNSDLEPLPPTQNQKTTSSLSSNNPKHNNRPSSNTPTLKCLNQQTQPLQINKHLPRLPSIQQEFLDIEPLDHHQRTLATRSITSSEKPQWIHPISRQQTPLQQSIRSTDLSMLNLTNLMETQRITRNGKKTVHSICSPTTTISQMNTPQSCSCSTTWTRRPWSGEWNSWQPI